MKKIKKKIREDLSEFSKGELASILIMLNHWEWDRRLGERPFMFHKLEKYKKPHNVKFRLECLFRIVWPFTKADHIQPIRHEIFKMYPELKHKDEQSLKDFFF